MPLVRGPPHVGEASLCGEAFGVRGREDRFGDGFLGVPVRSMRMGLHDPFRLLLLPPAFARRQVCQRLQRLVHRQPPSRVPRCPLTGYGRGLRDGAGRRRDPIVTPRVDTPTSACSASHPSIRLMTCPPPCAPPSGRR